MCHVFIKFTGKRLKIIRCSMFCLKDFDRFINSEDNYCDDVVRVDLNSSDEDY